MALTWTTKPRAYDWCRMHMEEPAEPAYTHTHTLPKPSVPELRKDREHPIIVTEYLSECRRDTPTWKQMPGRMLRHVDHRIGHATYCPAHGKMDSDLAVWLDGKKFCQRCYASALERIGVHQLVDKPPAAVKKW